MATFSYTPDFGLNISKSPRVKIAKFGDGYEQRVADGINTNAATYSLAFNARSDSEAAGIIAFLDARAGVEAFDWTTPDGVTGKFVCSDYNRTMSRYNINNVTATFRQVFE